MKLIDTRVGFDYGIGSRMANHFFLCQDVRLMSIRDFYQEKAAAQLCEWKTRIETIRSKFASSAEGVSPKNQTTLDRLEEHLQRTQTCLDELWNASEGRWEFSKQAVERAMIELKQALDGADLGYSGGYLELRNSRVHAYENFFRKG